MRNGYLGVALITLAFLLSATWASLNQSTTRLALAPEISAIKVERSFSVLAFEDKEKKKLGDSLNKNDYTVTVGNRKVIDLQVCSGSGLTPCATKIDKKALEYTVQFTGPATEVSRSDVFVNSRLGKNFLRLEDPSGTSFQVQDIGGFPTKTVRFLVDMAERDYVIVYQSQEMVDANEQPVAWESR